MNLCMSWTWIVAIKMHLHNDDQRSNLAVIESYDDDQWAWAGLWCSKIAVLLEGRPVSRDILKQFIIACVFFNLIHISLATRHASPPAFPFSSLPCTIYYQVKAHHLNHRINSLINRLRYFPPRIDLQSPFATLSMKNEDGCRGNETVEKRKK